MQSWFETTGAGDLSKALEPAAAMLDSAADANPAAMHVLNRTVTACNSYFMSKQAAPAAPATPAAPAAPKAEPTTAPMASRKRKAPSDSSSTEVTAR